MSHKDRTGQPVYPYEGQEIVRTITMSPATAAQKALAAYIRRLRFTIYGSVSTAEDRADDREFSIDDVIEDFPGAETTLTYPSASIIEAGQPVYTRWFTPGPIEESYDPTRGTVLWQLGVAEGTLQVDFWANSVPMRDAIAAELFQVMNPAEGSSGLLLVLPEQYACRTARFTLMGANPINVPGAAMRNERRLQATVRYDAPLISMRKAPMLSVKLKNKVFDGSDPERF